MENNKNNLFTKLWNIANELRGNMDSVNFKNYMLGFMFYRFICELYEEKLQRFLKAEGGSITLDNVDDQPEEFQKDLRKYMINKMGFYIETRCLFSNIIKKIDTRYELKDGEKRDLNQTTTLLEQGFHSITTSLTEESKDDFANLFDTIDLNSIELGADSMQRNKKINDILLNINEIVRDENKDIMGDAFEYCLSQFASDAGKKGGEFYTPAEVSELISKLVTLENSDCETIYDPTCGSGSLLIKAFKEVSNKSKNPDIIKLYGQELNSTTYNLARMNLLMHEINYKYFDIKQGDTLKNDHFNRKKFDVIVANPPFGIKWDPSGLESDDRFSEYAKMAPKSKSEFAFIQHMIFHLSSKGVMATVAPLGVLFRGSGEKVIREHLIEVKDCLDAVIGLPANLFFGTGIPACILVFKKSRKNKDILFIDASREFEKVKTQNKLTQENIDKILNTYKNREEIDKYSRNVSIEEIKENDFNLNLPRYIDTFEEEEEIDIDAVNKELAEIKVKIAEKEKLIEEMIKELM